MTQNFFPVITRILVALGCIILFTIASIIPIIGPGFVAYYSGRMQYFLWILSNFQVVLTILLSQLIIAVTVTVLWQITPLILTVITTNILGAVTMFFLGLKMEIRNQKRGITI